MDLLNSLTWANQARPGTPDRGITKSGQALPMGPNQVRTGENFTGRPHCGMLLMPSETAQMAGNHQSRECMPYLVSTP